MTTHDDIKMTCDLCRRELSMCICALGSDPLDTLEDAVVAKANREFVMVRREHLEAAQSYISRVEMGLAMSDQNTLADVFACACRGPAPECACAREKRLIAELTQALNNGEDNAKEV